MSTKLRIISTVFLLTAFVISLSIYFFFNFHKTERIFFFPEHNNSKTVGESRRIPRFINREKNVDVFTRELLLGPLNMKLDSLFSSGTKLEKMLYRNKIIYLDLDIKALFPDKKAIHGFDTGIRLLKKNIKFNFPYVEKVVVTISGEEALIEDR
ncbi:MAG: hypothetical protein RBT69_11190 [Spirochaetia bacterium]|nr:hypothetical protein [Spirochaetia bacterium]